MKFVLRNATVNDIDSLAKAYVRCWHDTYADIIPQEVLNHVTLPKSQKKWRNDFVDQLNDNDRAIFVIQNDAGDIVGFASCGASRARSARVLGQGEIFGIYVLQEYQGYGLGKALMLATSRWLISRGLFTGGIWVAEANGVGRRFCEDLGARIAGSRKTSKNGFTYTQIAMAWTDFSKAAQLEDAVPDWGDKH